MLARPLAVLLAVSACAFAAAAEPSSTRIIEIIGEKTAEERSNEASGVARLFRGEPCGSRQDGWFCGEAAPDRPFFTPTLAVSAPKGASVFVGWNGTVACEIRTTPAIRVGARAMIDFSVELALVEDSVESPEPSGEGRARLGRRFRMDATGPAFEEPAAVETYPVALSRVFVRRRSGAQDYRVRVDSVFRGGSTGVCAVSGGAMTAAVSER